MQPSNKPAGSAVFDVGPLSWVRAEINNALTRGLEHLAAFAADPSELVLLKQARTGVHQAAGAIQMVGLEAVVVFADEIERQLARLDDEIDPDEIPRVCALADRACRRLAIFLDEVVGGVQPQPLKLFPEYEAMQLARGVEAASPSDLFFPDLTPRVAPLDTAPPVPADQLGAHLLKQRRLYQGGMLAFLRGEKKGAQMLREAVGGIELAAERHSAGRAFWWTVGAFFDALIHGGIEPGFGAKQLAARLDLQIRRVVEGSTKVANRLRREVLYYVAVSEPVAATVDAVQRAYGLATLIPSAEVLNADLVRLQPILRDAREQLGAAKELWLRVSSGRTDRMPKLREALAAVRADTTEIGNPALSRLVASLEARLDNVPEGGVAAEVFAMEYATGILLAESAVENFSGLSSRFPKQVEAMLARLDAAQAGRPIPAATTELIDDIFRRAQERMLLGQVAREIQVNLRHIEQVLDAFFRDHGKRAELAALSKDSAQIRGALKMLGQDDAERLLASCQEQIEGYSNAGQPISSEDLEDLAESLSGLGFYVEALEQQRPDRQRLIAPLLAKRLGEEPAIAEEEPAETVEDAVEELRQTLPTLVAEVQRVPADAEARASLKSNLDEMVEDAKIIDDTELVAQVEAALAELEGGGTGALEAVSAIGEGGESAAAAPEISEETQRLLATDEQTFDAELMEIYLEEAAEVLDTVAVNRAELATNPGDREALRSARRQFHTLKGSGRMVGLMDLGEIAYAVEMVHNRLLEEERTVTPTMLALIGTAEESFREWVGALKENGSVAPDPARVYEAIRRVEAEIPSDESVAPVVPVAAKPEPVDEAEAEPRAEVESEVVLDAKAEHEPIAEVDLRETEPEPVAEVDLPEIEPEPVAEADLPEIEREPVAEADLPEIEPEPVAKVDLPEVEPEPVAEADLPEIEPEPVAEVDLPEIEPEPVPEAERPEIELEREAMEAESELPLEAELAALEAELVAGAESDPEAVREPEDEPEAFREPARLGSNEEAESIGDRIELPELGGAPVAMPGGSVAWADAASEGREEDSGIIDFTPLGEIPVAEAVPIPEPPPVPTFVRIGDVTLPSEMHRALVDEAEAQLATLEIELSLMQFDSTHVPSPKMVAASQALSAVHRSHGLPLVAASATGLAECLTALQHTEARRPEEALPILATAVHSLRELVGRVKAAQGFDAIDATRTAEIQRELERLRQAVGPPAVPIEREPETVGEESDEAETARAADPALQSVEEIVEATPLPAIEEPEEAEAFVAANVSEPSAELAAEQGERTPLPDIDEPDEDVAPEAKGAREPASEHAPMEAAVAAVAEGVHVPLDLPEVGALDAPPVAVIATEEGEQAEPEQTPFVAEPEQMPSVAEPEQTPSDSAPEQTPSVAEPEHTPSVAEPEQTSTVVTEPSSEPIPSEAALSAPAMAEAAPPTMSPSVRPPAAEAASAKHAPDPLADIRDDVDTQVLPIFLEEALELYPKASEQVRAWRRTPGDAAYTRQLQRTLHTFKGSARMAGAMRLGELAHLMEARLVVDDTPVSGSIELFEALDGDLDRIGHVLDALREGRTNVPLVAAPEALAAPAAETGAPSEKPRGAPAFPASDRGVVVPMGSTAATQRAAGEAVDVEGARAMLRVRADIIDRLVNEAGEVAIARARIETELRALKTNLLELTASVIRLRAQVREIEIQAESQIQSRLSQVDEHDEVFDPLEFDRYTRFQELARGLAEGVNDVSTVQQSLLRNLDVADAALVAQARLGRDLQQQLFSIRTVPFGSLSERLYRILRGTAKELDKRANLEIRGAQTELDRSVLEKLVGPLEHLLRNALDHGIEPRNIRLRAGKSETGEITLTVRQISNEIAIELSDDGGGLNLERVRAKAIAQGRFPPDSQPSEGQLMACIFEPGFSTAAKVTQVSGRGIGMDVVRSEIVALGGRIEVTSRPGHGTTFFLYLPLTLAVAQAVLVRAGGRTWAFPAPMVEQVQHVRADVLVNLYVQRHVEWQGQSYPFHYLPRLLGDSLQIPESGRTNPVMLLRSGQSLAAVHVDEMIGNQEVVVKNIGPQLARVSGIAGATVLGTGEIVLIINPVQLAQRTDVPKFDPDAERVAPEVPKMAVTQQERPLVMIVDDSLTVRRITSRLLQREGFDVLTARDGVDALELLESESPDVILLDIEMPRMDGFEFAKTIKQNPARARIPIVMITSRTAEKHRNRAKELGVDLYLGKPFQEEELLMHLREMLAVTS